MDAARAQRRVSFGELERTLRALACRADSVTRGGVLVNKLKNIGFVVKYVHPTEVHRGVAELRCSFHGGATRYVSRWV